MAEMLDARHAVKMAVQPRGVRLAEVHDVGKIDLRGNSADRPFMSAVGRVLDLLLPTEPCQSAAQGEIGALWVGPDQWLITCSRDQIRTVIDKLGDATGDTHASVTDISAGRTLFRLSGADTLDVLAKGCPLDLHPRVVKPGHVAGSVLARITALIHLRDADVVDIYVNRSFADHLWVWLEEAAMDCGLNVA